MIKFLKDFWILIKTHKKFIFIISAVIIGLILVSSVSIVALSQKSVFCRSCHLMEPYFKQWETSSHKTVECIKCHPYRSYTLLLSTMKYFSGAYNPRPRAQVSDKSCMREECHGNRTFETKKAFKRSIAFDHKSHLERSKRDEKLRCTTCHSQIVQGNHIAVNEKVCYLCHFKGARAGESYSGCPSCHGIPTKTVEHGGFSFNHAPYLKIGVSCKQCHVEIIKGKGEVPEDKCFTCHIERSEKRGDVKLLHDLHITKKSIDCLNCHEAVEHGNIKMVGPLEIRCENCHIKLHSVQKQMYMGIGGRGISDLPSRMFAAQVTCTGCHTNVTEAGVLLMGEKRLEAERSACVSCHGKGYDVMLDDWKKVMKQAINEFSPNISSSEKKIIEAKNKGIDIKRAMIIFNEAKYDFDFVKEGRGEHNVEYAVKILIAAADRIDQALKIIDKDTKPIKRVALIETPDGYCWSLCHSRIPFSKEVKLEGKKLPHHMHTTDLGLGCGACHSIEKHKAFKLDRKKCKDCHQK